MSSSISPLEDGCCQRCQAPQAADTVFCSECGLRLAAGMLGAEVAMREREAAWVAAHPSRAAEWQRAAEKLEAARARVARRNAARRAAAQEAPPAGRPAGSEALEQLAYWTMRGRLLWDLADEANQNAQKAYAACRAAGVSDAEARARMADATPPLRPGSTPSPTRSPSRPMASAPASAAAGGGFFLFYAESGVDMDGDGDVDGGLIDDITGGGEGGSLLDGLSDLFG